MAHQRRDGQVVRLVRLALLRFRRDRAEDEDRTWGVNAGFHAEESMQCAILLPINARKLIERSSHIHAHVISDVGAFVLDTSRSRDADRDEMRRTTSRTR